MGADVSAAFSLSHASLCSAFHINLACFTVNARSGAVIVA